MRHNHYFRRQADILLPALALCLILGLFLWLPNDTAALWLRRFFVLSAGGLATLYLLMYRPRTRLDVRVVAGLLAFLSVNTFVLLKSSGFGLVGQPIIHPALLSLYASFGVGLLWAYTPNKLAVFRAAYLACLTFALANIVLWLPHWSTNRLGAWGIQINYTAYVLVLGLAIGCYLFGRHVLPIKWLIAGQIFLLIVTLLTMSRIEIAVSLVCFGVFSWLVGRRLSKLLGFSLVGIVVILGSLGLFSHTFSRLHSAHYLSDSVRYRIELVEAAWSTDRHSLLLGQGVNGVENNITDHAAGYPLLARDVAQGWHFESSHNYFVDLLVERGIVALSLFVGLVVWALKRGLSSWSQTEQRPLLSLLAISLVFLLFNNANIQVELILWCSLLGLLMATNPSATVKKTPAVLRAVSVLFLIALALLLAAHPSNSKVGPVTFQKVYSDETFVDMWYSARLPGLESLAGPPEITGESDADNYIRNFAMRRGYRLQQLATQPLVSVGGRSLQPLAALAWQQLDAAALVDGVSITLTAGFRSAAEQRHEFNEGLFSLGCTPTLISQQLCDIGLSSVLDSMAPPGFSKEATGYVVDVAEIHNADFVNSRAFNWLSINNYANARRFGFVPSYPADAHQQGPKYEPWEYVWVGSDAVPAYQP